MPLTTPAPPTQHHPTAGAGRDTRRPAPSPFDTSLLGLLGLRIFETVGADIDDLGEEQGHRVLRVRGKGGKVVLVPLPPAVSRAVDRAAGTAPPGRSC